MYIVSTVGGVLYLLAKMKKSTFLKLIYVIMIVRVTNVAV